MTAQVSVVTGSSRGIGAATAIALAESGSDVAINYRSKALRAEEVASKIRALGKECVAIQADLSEEGQVAAFARAIESSFPQVNHLILNAAGGLERDKDEAYVYALNVLANERLLDHLLPVMPAGSSIVYVTSHPSHFYGRLPVMQGYERVASTKKAAEDALRRRIPELSEHGVRLAVVSGDLISGTINAKLMERAYPGMTSARSQEVGALPTIEEFSAAIVNAALNDSLPSGETILVGGTSWDTYNALYLQEDSSR